MNQGLSTLLSECLVVGIADLGSSRTSAASCKTMKMRVSYEIVSNSFYSSDLQERKKIEIIRIVEW